MSTNLDIHHLAAAYALDALDDRERPAFEAHYPACDVCVPDVHDFRSTLTAIGVLSMIPPSAHVKDAVIGQIATTRQLSPLLPDSVVELAGRRRTTGKSMLAAAAAVLLIVGSVAFAIGRRSHTDDAFAAGLEQLLSRPGSRFVELNPSTTAGHIRVVWSPTSGEVAVIGDGLPAPTSDKAYELWLINANGSSAMHLLDPAHNGSVQRILPMDGTPTKWGITLEPRQGSATPTGDLLFVGVA
jgi:Anti-sigma-K factor rskA